MNDAISKNDLDRLREKFTPGMRVELLRMNDPYRKLPAGSKGTVISVDEGTTHVQWDCGPSLGVVYGEDLCRPLDHVQPTILSDKVMEQILAIRDSGRTNMFDTRYVQRLANDCGYYELVIFLEEHKKEYVQFILTGER